MSQMPATTALRAPRRPAVTRPDLRVVTGSTRVAAPPRRLPFVLFCSGLLAVGLLALLFINMSLAQGAYQLHDLQSRSVVLSQDEQQLREELAVLESPAHLSRAAQEVGMVPGTVPAFLDVSERTVVGEAKPAPTPTATPSGSAGSAGTATGSASEPAKAPTGTETAGGN